MPPLNSSPWPPFLRRRFCTARRHGANANSSPATHHPLSPPMAPPSNPPTSKPPPPPPPPPPISRIPVELLAQIFTQVPRTEFYESLCLTAVPTGGGGGGGGATVPAAQRPSWLAITHVCRRWRAIAMDCKEFWSYITLGTRLSELSLVRSDPCPISLLVDFSSARPESYRRATLSALQAISRAREVHLQSSAAIPATTTSAEFRVKALRLLDATPAPLLETFSIRSDVSRDFVTLSGNIFLGNAAPALRSLTLSYCGVHHSSPLFRAPLVSLHLVNCLLEFPLEVLSLLPRLRTLVLEDTHGTRITNPPNDVFFFPELQHLELTDVSDVIAFLLRGIQIPSSSYISITCTDCIEVDEPLDDLTLLHTITSTISPVLSTFLERALEEGYVFPLLEIASPTTTSRKTLILLDPARKNTAGGTSQLRFSLVWATILESTDIFSQMLSALPPAALRRIRTLSMRDNPSLCAAADARSRPQPFAFAAFHDRARDEAVRGLRAIVMRQDLLPALCQISLEGMDFKNLDVDLLVRVLVHRQRASAASGGKIGLSLRNCLMNVGTIRGLRDCLGRDSVDVV